MNARFPAQRASALIAVYWVIAILSLSVFTAVHLVVGELDTRATQGQLFRAEQLADMGIAVAVNPGIQPGDPLLIQDLDGIESFAATIESEESRLNLNAVLARGDLILLQNLFTLWGMPPEEVIPLTEVLVDWVDADDQITGAGGAEFLQYANLGFPELPPNRQFLTLEEVALVRDVQQLLGRYQPEWRSVFTMWGSGLVDLSDAEPVVIAAACECSIDRAAAFVVERRGYDGLENTEDDLVYDSADQILDLLGVPVVGREAISARVGMGGGVTRIRSIGRVADVEIERIVVVQGRDSKPTIVDVQTRRLAGSRSE
ncbi:MAG: type II secretory pathway component PulK [Verrucomicrobiales bacterium]